MRPVALLAVALSGVLGVALGITGGLALDREQPEAAAFVDPLGLGVPNRNQPCTNQALLTVGRGPGASQLAPVIAQNLDRGIAYLDTSKSCPTAWLAPEKPTPRYVAYLGPFETRALACDAQFSSDQHAGVVTRLKANLTDPVPCLCYVQLAPPRLQTGITTDGSVGIWVRQLQHFLVEMGRATDQDATGTYDETTATKIRDFQRDVHLNATGVVDSQTWEMLRRKGCQLYHS